MNDVACCCVPNGNIFSFQRLPIRADKYPLLNEIKSEYGQNWTDEVVYGPTICNQCEAFQLPKSQLRLRVQRSMNNINEGACYTDAHVQDLIDTEKAHIKYVLSRKRPALEDGEMPAAKRPRK